MSGQAKKAAQKPADPAEEKPTELLGTIRLEDLGKAKGYTVQTGLQYELYPGCIVKLVKPTIALGRQVEAADYPTRLEATPKEQRRTINAFDCLKQQALMVSTLTPEQWDESQLEVDVVNKMVQDFLLASLGRRQQLS